MKTSFMLSLIRYKEMYILFRIRVSNLDLEGTRAALAGGAVTASWLETESKICVTLFLLMDPKGAVATRDRIQT
jgi:hypothetical protein